MHTKIEILLLSIMLMFISCDQSNKTITEKKQVHQGATSEVIESGDYTIIKFNEGKNNSVWVATKIIHPTQEPQVGEIYFFDDGEMKTNYDFEDINRSFDTIYFVDKISMDPSVFGISKDSTINVSQEAIKPKIEKKEVQINAADSSITIDNLFANKNSFQGKTVSIKGIVIKFNSSIMNMNWIHLQDGTSYNDMFDLTATTDATVTVGDTIIATGTITLDKDFGYGYFYPVLMENTNVK